MIRLNRKQKIICNTLLCVICALALYALLDSPAYTVAGMCHRMQRDYLLPELEPVYVERQYLRYSGEVLQTRVTFVIAKAGEDYISFGYQTHLLHSKRNVFRNVGLEKGGLCAAKAGTLYVASEKLEEAESATAVVCLSDNPEAHQSIEKKYPLQGHRAAEQVFTFSFADTNLRAMVSDQYALEDTVPVVVTLYDSGGVALETLTLDVRTWELASTWW